MIFPALAVTGGVGCGKSAVGRLLAGAGVRVLDADEVVHGLLEQDPQVRAAVSEAFPGIVADGGALDRRRLAGEVFADAAARRRLEAILHPPTLARIRAWREDGRLRAPVAALIPLLFEVGLETEWDVVWCVSASPAVVRARLRERGWTDAMIAARQAAQWPLAEKEKRADRVIRNDGGLDELAAETRRALDDVLKRSEEHGG